MGWHVAGGGTIEIPAESQPQAHLALLALAASNERLGATRPHALLGAPNLVAYLIRAGFAVSVEGDAITGLDFLPDPVGGDHRLAGSLDQTVLLDALAPYARPGGRMDFRGEADEAWAHLFDGHAMLTVTLPGAGS